MRAVLRYHINVQVRGSDRFLFVWLYRLWPSVLGSIVIVQPETVVRWHRDGFKAFWRLKSRGTPGRPPTSWPWPAGGKPWPVNERCDTGAGRPPSLHRRSRMRRPRPRVTQETAGTAVALEVWPLPTNLAPGMWFRSCDLCPEMTVVPRPPPLHHPRIGAILILAGIRIDRRAT